MKLMQSSFTHFMNKQDTVLTTKTTYQFRITKKQSFCTFDSTTMSIVDRERYFW